MKTNTMLRSALSASLAAALLAATAACGSATGKLYNSHLLNGIFSNRAAGSCLRGARRIDPKAFLPAPQAISA